MTDSEKALDWVNEKRAERGLPTLAEWPENRPPQLLESRSQMCPIAQALGEGYRVGFSTATGPNVGEILDLPHYVCNTIEKFDYELKLVPV